MKRFSITLLTSLHFLFANAQSPKNVEEHQVQLSLPMPGILYEIAVSNNTTLSLEAMTGLAIRGCTNCDTEFGVYPILRGQYRYYYNMDRRLRAGKNIKGNSGNYIAALLGYQNGNAIIGNLDDSSNNIIGFGPVYGWQRTYRGGFFYRLEGGVAYFEDNFSNEVGLILAARVGWVIGKRR